jgi:hypothetical protein
MVSTAQLAANRKNAKKGGVKTELGKSISRFNAIKHGIFTSVLIGYLEDGQVLNQIRNQAVADLKPKGFLEEVQVDRIVENIWRLRRSAMADNAETQVEYSEMKTQRRIKEELRALFSKIWVAMPDQTLLLRYETTIERQLYRAIRELRDLQKIRHASELKDLSPTVANAD